VVNINDIEIWRVSFVRMYYSKPEYKKRTPDPFVELRVFVFRKTEPTQIEKQTIKDYFSKILDSLEILFPSIVESKEYKKVLRDEKTEQTILRIKKKTTERVTIEIDGYEIEQIDFDEAMKFFKGRSKRIIFNKPYRYVAFFDTDGEIKKDYNEFEIRRMEKMLEERLKKETGE